MSKHGIKITDIDKPCSNKEDFIIKISMEIDDHDYIEFGRHLRFSESELTSITQENDDDDKRKVAVLSIWRDRMAKNATYLALIRACLKAKLQSVAECVIIYAKNTSDMSYEGETLQLFPEKCCSWDNMTEIEKETVINDLLKEYKDVTKAFASLVLNLSRSFCK